MKANRRARLTKQTSIVAGAAVLVAAGISAVQLNLSDSSEPLPAAPRQDRVADNPHGADGGTVPSAPMPDQATLASGSAEQLSSAQPRLGTGAGPELATGMTMGIPTTVLDAYQHAVDVTNAAQPGCHIPISLLAAIGRVESGHASGGQVDTNGTSMRPILGPMLNGSGVAAISDTDNGLFDGSTTWDRAVGPMQFIPSTWRSWASDGNGDGRADPHNVYDASLASARYLCAGGRDLSKPGDLDAAILSYNHSTAYLHLVRAWMKAYDNTMVPVADSAAKQASLAVGSGRGRAKAPKANDGTVLGAPVVVRPADSTARPPALSGGSSEPGGSAPGLADPGLVDPGQVDPGQADPGPIASAPTAPAAPPPLISADVSASVAVPPLLRADAKVCVSLLPLRLDLGLLANVLGAPVGLGNGSPRCGGAPPSDDIPPCDELPPCDDIPPCAGIPPCGDVPPGDGFPPGPGDPGCVPCQFSGQQYTRPISASEAASQFTISRPTNSGR